MRALLPASLLMLAAAGAGAADAVSLPRIDRWKVPFENSRPRDPDVDRNGIVWFVGQTGDYVAAFDPAEEQFRKFDLDEGTGPHNLIIGEDRYIWYSGNRAAHIGRIDPNNGTIEKIQMPESVTDPHTLIGDGRGHIWFTAQRANYLGRLTLANRKVEVVKSTVASSLPYGIDVDASGRPWANLLGTNKLATLDPRTLALDLVDIPRGTARTRRIEVAEDGKVWYTDYSQGVIGSYDPKTRRFEEWPAPAGTTAKPYAMALDDRGRVWFADSAAQPNHLIAFDIESEKFVVDVEVKDARGAIRHMVFHEPGRALWFGTDTNDLVRVRVP